MISGAPLRRLLVEKDMTLTLLSQVTGIEERTLSLITNGRSITKSNLDKICSTLQCQPCDVIEYIKDDDCITLPHWEFIH
jgi:putative transcriptional regulator